MGSSLRLRPPTPPLGRCCSRASRCLWASLPIEPHSPVIRPAWNVSKQPKLRITHMPIPAGSVVFMQANIERSSFMKNKTLVYAVRTIAVLVLAIGTSALAQPQKHMSFAGTLNDHTVAAAIGGPWEVRGHWTLKVKGYSGKADFSAALTMERSDQ